MNIHRRGSTLLLAIIVLSAMFAIGTGFSYLVLDRLRDAQRVDQLSMAVYAAESGVEEFLYQQRHDSGETELSRQRDLTNGASWALMQQQSLDEGVYSIQKDGSEQIDLFPINTGSGPINISALRFHSLASDPGAWLEITWIPWFASGEWSPVSERSIVSPSDLTSGVLVPLLVRQIVTRPTGYRVRLRAIGGNLNDVRVRATADVQGAISVPMPTRQRAVIVGQMGNASYAMAVEFPERPALAPIFDFVLFSECDIVKGEEVQCP
jgi:hypothetical protein